MIIQIYEIQTTDEARRMIELGVDHIGSVILSARQWRNAELQNTIKMVRAAGRRSTLIPLFDDPDVITEAVEYYRPDILHFCEALNVPEDPVLADVVARQKRIRRNFKQLQIMRSIPIGIEGWAHKIPSLAWAALFEPHSDWFLTDTLLMDRNSKEQPVDGYVGITGQTCDWDLARRLVATSSIPVILAGGIGPENVREGIARVKPAGIDSCTRTNALDPAGLPVRFRKDYHKVKNLVGAARLTDQANHGGSPPKVQ